MLNDLATLENHLAVPEIDKHITTVNLFILFMGLTVVLEIFESPLDRKQIQPVHPKRNQSWIFIGRTDVEAETPKLWPPDVKH